MEVLEVPADPDRRELREQVLQLEQQVQLELQPEPMKPKKPMKSLHSVQPAYGRDF